MLDSESNQIRVIKKIELGFGRHRRDSDGNRYPAKLKELALAAVDSGVGRELRSRPSFGGNSKSENSPSE